MSYYLFSPEPEQENDGEMCDRGKLVTKKRENSIKVIMNYLQ